MENKTLWDRLNPEIKEKLNNENKTFPTVINSITKALKELNYVTDMSYDTAMRLVTYGGVKFDSIYVAFKN